MSDPDPAVAGAGWALTTERVAKKPEGLKDHPTRALCGTSTLPLVAPTAGWGYSSPDRLGPLVASVDPLAARRAVERLTVACPRDRPTRGFRRSDAFRRERI